MSRHFSKYVFARREFHSFPPLPQRLNIKLNYEQIARIFVRISGIDSDTNGIKAVFMLTPLYDFVSECKLTHFHLNH